MSHTQSHEREFIHLWPSPATEGVELYSANLVSHTFGKHLHDEYTIGINDAGCGSFRCRRTTYIAAPKSLNLLSPGEVHTGEAQKDHMWTYRNIYVTSARIKSTLWHLDLPFERLPEFQDSVVVDEDLWTRFDGLFRTLNQPDTRLAADSILINNLMELFRRATNVPSPAERIGQEISAVTRCHDFLEANYAEEVSLDDLGRIGRISPFHLVRCFRQRIGLPPHAYQIQVRLRFAKADLAAGMPIADAALKHGFYDQSHLHRHFKRAFGITPGQYQKSNFVQDQRQSQ